jgi:hypothetical protein
MGWYRGCLKMELELAFGKMLEAEGSNDMMEFL